MHQKILYWSITVALAGFLFGFDTVVISGAEQQLQTLWNTSNNFHGFIMSTALWGTVVGAVLGSIPTDKLGRKQTLIWIGVLYFISAVGSALVSDPYSFGVFRFIGGLGVGVSTIAAPAYVSEIAPAKDRGRLVAMYQFNIVFGILMAYISNSALRGIGDASWRWMIGVEAIPAFIYTVLVLGVPRSPRWLITIKDRVAEARSVLETIHPGKAIDPIIQQIKSDHARGQVSGRNEPIVQPKYRKLIFLAFFIAFFNQLSGINAVLYYAPRIFAEAGLGEQTAFISSIGLGLINLVATLVGLYLIDRIGRKTLMYIGSTGYIISLSMVAAAFFFGWQGLAIPIFLFLFIASHAVGQGAVIWVFISEIFPNHLRAQGQSFGSSTHWILAALITVFMPPLLSSDTFNPGFVFVFFAAMMVMQLLWVRFAMPETKGVPLEDLQKQLVPES
jgi:sugar porter (SP) family MFS transporter